MIHKPRLSSSRYDSPYGEEEWEEDFSRWESAEIDRVEAEEIERMASAESKKEQALC